MGFFRWLPVLASLAYALPSLAAAVAKPSMLSKADSCLWGKRFETDVVPASLEDGALLFDVTFRKVPESMDSGIFGAYIVDDRGNVVGKPINARAQKVSSAGFKERLRIPRLNDGFYAVYISVVATNSESELSDHAADEQVVYLEVVAQDPILIPYEDWYERSRVARGNLDIETWTTMRRSVGAVVGDSEASLVGEAVEPVGYSATTLGEEVEQ